MQNRNLYFCNTQLKFLFIASEMSDGRLVYRDTADQEKIVVYSVDSNTPRDTPIEINPTATRPEVESDYCYCRDCQDDSDEEPTINTDQKIKVNLKPCETYRLELIYGPMFSGKSTELIRRLKNKSIYKKVSAVNTKKDARYGSDGVITHDGLVMTSLRVLSLYELRNVKEYIESEVVGIDEANFFPEITKFIVEELESTNKTFIVAGLNGDKDRQFFGKMHELIPHAEKIDFLKALCKQCADGTEASFSVELEKFEGQEKIGGSGDYEAVCRKHYSQMKGVRKTIA